MSTSDIQNAEAPCTETPFTEVSLTKTAPRLERRKWPRLSDEKRSRVWFSTAARGAQYGQLENIGLGGFSMIVRDGSQFQPDQQIVVGLGEWMVRAKVKHVHGNAQAGYCVGMEWARPGSTAVMSILEQYGRE